ncbi:MAG: endonuclease III domain-containing protein [Candidatus Omnitrophica bacterium]|nr:endonuclease III domain-containing protein [Candidatus Omnitrophota bacterium]
MEVRRRTLLRLYRRLFDHFGPQHWWPARSPFEVAVGAVLTQSTAWSNASKAVRSLRSAKLLVPGKLDRIPHRELAPRIRSCGYFNQKAKRLKGFVRYLRDRHAGSMRRMRGAGLSRIRRELLDLPGIGPETADSILLYALQQPVFVVDAYTRRILSRHSLIPRNASYEEIQALFMTRLPRRTQLFNEYHALLVAAGKGFCLKTDPNCPLCPLRRIGHLRLENSL